MIFILQNKNLTRNV